MGRSTRTQIDNRDHAVGELLRDLADASERRFDELAAARSGSGSGGARPRAPDALFLTNARAIRAPDAAATCFVKYELVSSAVKAHAALHAREFDGNVVRASFLRPEVLGW